MSLPAVSTPIARADVANLAHLATALEYLKNKFTDPMWRAALRRAVIEMHGVATEIDAEHGFGIYQRED
ncbi:MAG: hypothetical protein JNK99_15640 [Candidatus Accumulibacter sp.]|uniref:hypothetical protein n=1 Tax=Accumulibacter sp. TaxID=2053492 RepID=UPI001A3A841D|nr:hypothetical protein [Accumulibacter sp.]MBL8396152.1 hypothetical protein [Accumulibacter sp.]